MKSSKKTVPAPAPTDTIFIGRRKVGPSREDLLRMEIATIDKCPTLYRPVQNFLMIAPLPDQGTSDGGIILPNQSRVTYNEGHIIAKGPTCIHKWDLGDCVSWPQHQEFKVAIEGYTFVLIQETAIILVIRKEQLEEQRTRLGECCPLCLGASGKHKPDCPKSPEVSQDGARKELTDDYINPADRDSGGC